MKTKAKTGTYTCDYCNRIFDPSQEDITVKKGGVASFLLCPKCDRHRHFLVSVRCANCKRTFPRLRWVVKARRRYSKRAYCPACHTERQAPKSVKVTCSECGRTYERTLEAEKKSQRDGYKRRICPLCRPAKTVMVVCVCCRKQFPRLLSQVRIKERRGYRWAICPRCFVKRQSKKSNRRGGKK